MQLGSHEKQKFPRCCPLPGGQVEHRSPVNFRGDAAVAWHYVMRITGVSGRGVDAELVLEVQVRLAHAVVIAKDTAFCHRTVLLAGPERAREIEPPSGSTPESLATVSRSCIGSGHRAAVDSKVAALPRCTGASGPWAGSGSARNRGRHVLDHQRLGILVRAHWLPAVGLQGADRQLLPAPVRRADTGKPVGRFGA